MVTNIKNEINRKTQESPILQRLKPYMFFLFLKKRPKDG